MCWKVDVRCKGVLGTYSPRGPRNSARCNAGCPDMHQRVEAESTDPHLWKHWCTHRDYPSQFYALRWHMRSCVRYRGRAALWRTFVLLSTAAAAAGSALHSSAHLPYSFHSHLSKHVSLPELHGSELPVSARVRPVPIRAALSRVRGVQQVCYQAADTHNASGAFKLRLRRHRAQCFARRQRWPVLANSPIHTMAHRLTSACCSQGNIILPYEIYALAVCRIRDTPT